VISRSMGSALSCVPLPCVPKKSADDFSDEFPRESFSTYRQNETEKLGGDAKKAAGVSAQNRGKREEPEKVGATTTTLLPSQRKTTLALRQKDEKDALHCLTSTLKDKQLTTLIILTSTVIGSIVGIFSMSGVSGSIAYLVVLLVQLCCATLSKMLVQDTNAAAVAAAEQDLAAQKASNEGNAYSNNAEAVVSKCSTTTTILEDESEQEGSRAPKEGVAPKLHLPQGFAIEPRTKHKHPYVMNEHDGYPHEVELLSGLGIRDKRVIALTIDVYSVGIYVNAAQFHNALGSKYGDLDRNAFRESASEVFEDVINATESVSRTIRIEIQFNGLTSKMLVNAFDERLEKLMKDANEVDVYEVLRSGLGSVKLYPGRVILLRMKTDGYLVATSDNEVLANTQSHTLCKAVTDIYLGRESPTPVLKHDAATRMYETLHAPNLEEAAAATSASSHQDSGGRETDQLQPADEQPSDLTGTWEVTVAEQVEEFMIALGISFLVRKIAVQLYMKDMKIIEQKGNDVSFTDFRNRREGRAVLFEENKLVHRKDKQGRELNDLASWDGSVLNIRTEGYQDPLSTKYWRESSDTMISETTVKGVTMKRTWKLMD